MVSIVITNTRCKIVGDLHPEKEHQYAFHNMLREKCGYMVPNAEWSPAYKNNVWDGIISLYDKKTQSFPTGLLSNVLNALKWRAWAKTRVLRGRLQGCADTCVLHGRRGCST